MPIQGIIFDLDGTLVDSRLDFDRMREEMGLPAGVRLLETLAQLPPAEADRCHAILARHEEAGARCATLVPGILSFLAEVATRNLRQAVLTRNGADFAHLTLRRLDLRFEQVLTRDDGPIKPDPASIWRICETWRLPPAECLMIGDYRFDLEAGRAAGTKTTLYTELGRLRDCPWSDLADFQLDSFENPRDFWQWFDGFA